MKNSADPDLDLHCLQRLGISGVSRTELVPFFPIWCLHTAFYYCIKKERVALVILKIRARSSKKLFLFCNDIKIILI